MKIFQNKIVVGVICIVLAAVLAFFLLPILNKGKSKTVKIIKVTEEISAGTIINEAHITEKEVGSYGLPEGVIKDKSEIVGKYATVIISPEDIITKTKLSDHSADKKMESIMNNGQMLLTISIESIAAGVGNNLQKGDIISIISYTDGEARSIDILSELEVYSIENDEAQELEDVQGDEQTKKIASSITLIVNREQAQQLVQAEYSGKIHAVLVKRGGNG